MKPEQLLRAILPSVIIDNFDIDKFEKTETRFDIWLDEKKVQMRDDKNNSDVIAYGFGEYHNIQDYPLRVGPLGFTCASVSGWTRVQERFFPTTGPVGV